MSRELRRTLVTGFVASLTMMYSVSTAQGIEVAGTEIPDSITDEGKALVLNGAGVREVEFLGFDVYAAGLYVEERAQDGAKILGSPGPKLLQINFLRDVEVSEIHEDLDEGFNNHQRTSPALQASLRELKSFMTDMKKGQRLLMKFYPAKLEVVRPDGKVQSFEGAEFSKSVLEIWIGAHAQKVNLKQQLLSGKR